MLYIRSLPELVITDSKLVCSHLCRETSDKRNILSLQMFGSSSFIYLTLCIIVIITIYSYDKELWSNLNSLEETKQLWSNLKSLEETTESDERYFFHPNCSCWR